MAGQPLVKSVMKAIIKDPDNAPRSIILEGAYGTGKTTSCRILAKALNCPHKDKEGNPCNKDSCPICSQDLNQCSFYTEYDASIVGTVDKMREIADSFYSNMKGFYKVIVLDEVHVCSRQSMTTLLKYIEEAPKGIIFIFATTHAHQLLPTIISRSLQIKVTKVPREDIIANIKSVGTSLDISIDDNCTSIIADKSKGHMRNAHMLLDMYQLVGEEEFKKSVKSSRDALIKYMIAIYNKNKAQLFVALKELQTMPIADIHDDFNGLLLDMTRYLIDKQDNPLSKLSNAYGAYLLKFIKEVSSDWFTNSFDNDVTLQTSLLALFEIMITQMPTREKNKTITK